MKEDRNKKNILPVIALHILLLFYSFGGVCSKIASGTPFLSVKFIVYYGGLIAVLGVYAIVWQQIIKRLPLTFAYSNKAVTVVWGMIWGMCFFGETITAQKAIGAVIVIVGVILYSLSDKKLVDNNE